MVLAYLCQRQLCKELEIEFISHRDFQLVLFHVLIEYPLLHNFEKELNAFVPRPCGGDGNINSIVSSIGDSSTSSSHPASTNTTARPALTSATTGLSDAAA